MRVRATWTVGVAIASLAIVGCPHVEQAKLPENAAARATSQPKIAARPTSVVGFYIHDDPAFYGAKDMSGVPPGQIMYLGIEEGRWMMRNMLTGYGGPWKIGTGGAILRVAEGPTGKANGKEKLAATRTEQGVTLSLKGSNQRVMRFTYLAVAAPQDFGYDEFLGPKK